MKITRRGGGKDKPPDNKKVVDLKLFQGKKKEACLNPEQLTELRKELDDYKVSLVKDGKNPGFQRVAEALIACDGYIQKSANKLHISYSRLHKIIKANPKLTSIITDTKNAFVDLAENVLKDLVLSRNVTAVIFTLKNLGAARGWRDEDKKIGEVIDDAAKIPNFRYEVCLPKNFVLTPVEEEKKASEN